MLNGPTKFSITHYDTTTSWEINHSDITLDTLFPGIVSCLMGIGFSMESIISYIREYTEDQC